MIRGPRDLAEQLLEKLWYAPRGLPFALVAPLLGPLTVGAWVSGLRRRHAGPRLAEPGTLGVGNLAVGGTGKTQIVLELARRALAQGRRVAVVSRGYGGSEPGPAFVAGDAGADEAWRRGDEPVFLAQRLGSGVIVASRDRALGCALARSMGAELLILDDALQQTSVRLARRICVFGAESPVGNGALLPLGPLRDTRRAVQPRDVVWVHGEGAARGIARIDVRSRTRAMGLVPAAGQGDSPSPLGLSVFAVAGIARPGRFVATLAATGARIVGQARFADHHRFSAADLSALAARASALGAQALVCTEKDAVRLPATRLGFPIFALRTELEILEGETRVEALLAP